MGIPGYSSRDTEQTRLGFTLVIFNGVGHCYCTHLHVLILIQSLLSLLQWLNFRFVVDFESQIEDFTSVEALSTSSILRQFLPGFPRLWLKIHSKPSVVTVMDKIEDYFLSEEVFLSETQVIEDIVGHKIYTALVAGYEHKPIEGL